LGEVVSGIPEVAPSQPLGIVDKKLDE